MLRANADPLHPEGDLSRPCMSVRLPAGVAVGRSDDAQLFLVEDGRRVSLGPDTDDLRMALKLLRHGVMGFEALVARFTPLAEDFAHLLATGWLATAVSADDTLAAEVRTFGPVAGSGPDFARPVALSRFALVRRVGDAMMLESALAAASARVVGRAAWSWLFDLAQPSDLSRSPNGTETWDAFVRVLAGAGFLANVPGPEDESFRLAQWSAHEALCHGRSRWSTLNGTMPVGPSAWAAGAFESSAARLPERPASEPVAETTRRITLERPNAGRWSQDGPPSFFDVLERRKSVRLHGADNPLNLKCLSEFLFHAARVRSTFSYDGVEYSDRPYPSGGGAHELELYIAVRQVSGLAPGFYHYDPFDHALEVVSGSPEVAGGFAASAARATTLPQPPQAVIVVSARFGRLLGRYRAMGYATVLKNVGVLYQTMYLVATALGLAPCALGNGDLDLFAAVSGADPWEEASVGEFALGSMPKAPSVA